MKCWNCNRKKKKERSVCPPSVFPRLTFPGYVLGHVGSCFPSRVFVPFSLMLSLPASLSLVCFIVFVSYPSFSLSVSVILPVVASLFLSVSICHSILVCFCHSLSVILPMVCCSVRLCLPLSVILCMACLCVRLSVNMSMYVSVIRIMLYNHSTYHSNISSCYAQSLSHTKKFFDEDTGASEASNRE